MNENTFILIGLGNPGRQYAGNRHNVGFMVIDRLAKTLGARGTKIQSHALVSIAAYEGMKLLLAKPQTYMNLSGQAVQGLALFYKTPLEHLLVAHDDLDLAFGMIRLRPGGGPGGQKGVASTIERLGSQGFGRLRIGIGRPPGRMDPAKYVLQNFLKDEVNELPGIITRATEAALLFVSEGISAAMNKYNGGPPEP